MTSKFKAAWNSGGFYAALAVCVLAVGAGGYFLLFHQEPEPEIQPPAVDVSMPTPYVTVTDPPKTETLVPVEEPEPLPVIAPTPMPEVKIDDTPVIAEVPRLVVTPLRGDVVTAFAMDELVYSETMADWRTHDGIDIAAAQGTTVMSASSGTVSAVLDDPMMGTTVVIDHDGGYQTTYANLQARPNVREGDSVSAGQIIGAVGSTAPAESAQTPHLHFSVTKDGEAIDPEEYLKK